jgi:hypothetical protein
MKPSITLLITSLLSVLLFALHWSFEIAHGMETGRVSNLGGVVILLVWLYGTLALADRRSGLIITLLGGILGLGVLVLHMTGKGLIGGRVAVDSSGAFLWVSITILLGVLSGFAAIVSAHRLIRRVT